MFNIETDPPVLDLCVKNKREPPSYTLTYPSPRHSPEHQDTQQQHVHYTNTKSPRTISEYSEDSGSPKSLDATDYTGSKITPKAPRPFKAFPKNPLAFTVGIFTKIDALGTTEPVKKIEPSALNYGEFREKMLAKVQDYKATNANMRRNQNQEQRNDDPSYLERRKKNNEAAKRSRDARKAREDEIAIRCAFLERENMKMRANLASVEADVERLKKLIFRR